MKIPRGAWLSLVALLLTGCTIFRGIRVEVIPQSAEAFEKEIREFLVLKGFEIQENTPPMTERFIATRRTPNGAKISLFATFHFEQDRRSFFVGKVNDTKFFDDDVSLMDAFAVFLASRAELLRRGSASENAASEAARAVFYASIRKA